MIISHKHQFIFFAIPKTGTHSVRQALRNHLGPEDLEQVGLFVKKQFPFAEFGDIKHGHISAQQIKPVVGEEIYSRYFKFAFVRNPYDRFVSYCAFMGRKGNQFEAAPLEFMKYIVKQAQPMDHVLYRPQHEFITNADGRPMIDFVGRTEDMQGSYDAICQRLGIATEPLGKVNSTQHRSYREYYDLDLFNRVTEVYARDLELFNYEFDRKTRS